MVWVIAVPFDRDTCPANTALLREDLVSLEVQSCGWLAHHLPSLCGLEGSYFTKHVIELDVSVESETIHLSFYNSVYAAKQNNLCHIPSNIHGARRVHCLGKSLLLMM